MPISVDRRGISHRLIVGLLERFGIGTLFYGLATVAEFVVSGQLSGLRQERRNQSMIDSYSDHFIICGFGPVGYKASGSEMARLALHPVTVATS